MFFNEIAMVPTHRNLLHEFTHTEVAAYSDPSRKQAVITFLDSDVDDYTRGKVATLAQLFDDKAVPRTSTSSSSTSTSTRTTSSRSSCSPTSSPSTSPTTSANSPTSPPRPHLDRRQQPWWSQRSIELFPKCVDIPPCSNPAPPYPSPTAVRRGFSVAAVWPAPPRAASGRV